MTVNNIQEVNFGQRNDYRGPSIIGTVATDAIAGGIVGAGFEAFLKGLDEDRFVQEGHAALKSKNKIKTADELATLFKAEKTSAARKEIVNMIKTKRALNGLKWGALWCGAFGLVFGIINKIRYNNQMKRYN